MNNQDAIVCRFKNTVKYLRETRELELEEIAVLTELNQVTIQKVLDSSKGSELNIRNDTWSKIEDFNEHYREEVGELPVAGEAEETVNSYHFKGNGKGKKEDVLVVDDDKKWKALRDIVEAFDMKVTVTINIE